MSLLMKSDLLTELEGLILLCTNLLVDLGKMDSISAAWQAVTSQLALS